MNVPISKKCLIAIAATALVLASVFVAIESRRSAKARDELARALTEQELISRLHLGQSLEDVNTVLGKSTDQRQPPFSDTELRSFPCLGQTVVDFGYRLGDRTVVYVGFDKDGKVICIRVLGVAQT